ncbi:MAG: TonB family protein [Desulfobacteraceae bacterium]|jgi:protein TonB
MDIKTNSIASLPASVLVASIATSLLFISIPLLTKISIKTGDRIKTTPLLINPRKPQPPSEPEQEEKLQELKKLETPERVPSKKKMPQPRLDIPVNGLTEGLGGTIPISNFLDTDFKVTESLYASAFLPDEVDQGPRPVRQFEPRYPFEAQQKGIEGKITVKFVVDSTGTPQEPEIVKVEPEEVEGVFDTAALECIKKFKYRPAIKGGKPVDSIAGILFTFSVSE